MADPYGALKQDLVSSLNASARDVRARHRPGLLLHAPKSKATPDIDDFSPVDASGVGDFPWEWNHFENFNADTWTYLNTIAAKSDDGFISFTAGLTTWYYNVISATAYLWTDADRQGVAALLAKAKAVQQLIVSTYVQMTAPILPDARTAAATTLGVSRVSPLSYVVDYRIAYQWSGREAAGHPPLTVAEVRTADLDTLFAAAPAGARDALLPHLRDALQYEAEWAAAVDALWNRSRAIRDAANNAHTPNDQNKAGRLVFWQDGQYEYRNAFDVAPSPNDLRTELSSTDTVQLTFSAMRRAGDQAAVTTPNGISAQVPASVLSVQPKSGAARHLFAHDGAGDAAEVQIVYHGPAEISVSAVPFDPASSTGWYFENPITQAATNLLNNELAGYQFQVPIAVDDEHWAEFGLLRKLLICREVEVRVLYPQGDLARLSASVPVEPGDSVALLGKTHIKGTKDQPIRARVEADPATGAPAMVLSAGPPGQGGTPGPRVHVIGAQLAHPFPDIEPLAAPTTEPQIALMSRKARQRVGDGGHPMLLSLNNGAGGGGAGAGGAGGTGRSPADVAKNAGRLDPGAALVRSYEETFGALDPAELKANGDETALDYILTHVIGREWAGVAKGAAPLTVDQLRAAPNLRAALPNMPLEGAPILTELHQFLSAQV